MRYYVQREKNDYIGNISQEKFANDVQESIVQL
jgi:hypothetical protein